MIPAVRYSKNADSAVLREKPIILPRNASASEWTLPRILEIKISRDTKSGSPRELTKSNPFSRKSVLGHQSRLFFSNPTGAEQAMILNRGKRFLISEIFTLDHADKSHIAKYATNMF